MSGGPPSKNTNLWGWSKANREREDSYFSTYYPCRRGGIRQYLGCSRSRSRRNAGLGIAANPQRTL